MRLITALLSVCMLVGCANSVNEVKNSIPTAQNSVARVDAYLDTTVKAIDSKAYPVAKEAALDARTENQTTGKMLTVVQTERDQLETINAKQQQDYKQLSSKWYVTTGKWIERVFWLLVTIYTLHIVLGVAALFIPGIWGSVLAKISIFCNIFAWFAVVREVIYRKRAGKLER